MDREALHVFMNSQEFTRGEKSYIFDFVMGMGGGFTRALFTAISKADWENLSRLETVFPEQVQGYRAYAHGDLSERIRRVTGQSLPL